MWLRLTGKSLEFACHSSICRPPTSGGTGGSTGGLAPLPPLPKMLGMADGRLIIERSSGHGPARSGHITDNLSRSSVISATSSPHYQKRDASVMPISEADGLKLIRDTDATGRRVLDKGVQIKDGDPVGVRANLNVKKVTGITVQTVHQGTDAQLKNGTGMFSGEAVGYTVAATLTNVNLSVNQQARYRIASRAANKYPMASVDGKFKATDSPDKFDGVELRFNPMKQHVFVDPDGRAVKSVSEATVVGSSVFARGKITYYTAANLPKPIGDIPTDAHA